MAKVTVEFPGLRFGLELPERRVLGAAARAMAKAHRRNLRSGRDSVGRPIEPPDSGGRPLRETGRLIRSIKGYTRKRRGETIAIVGATGEREDLGSSLRGRQAGLLGVQIYGRRTESRRPRNPTLMESSASLERAGLEAFEAATQKALNSGKARIVETRRRF